jgi:hypothetical protein
MQTSLYADDTVIFMAPILRGLRHFLAITLWGALHKVFYGKCKVEWDLVYTPKNMVHIGILCLHRLIQESYEVKMALV